MITKKPFVIQFLLLTLACRVSFAWSDAPGLQPINSPMVLSNNYIEVSTLSGTTVDMYGNSELRIMGSGIPLADCTINLNSIDAWVFLTEVSPSDTIALLHQFKVGGAHAENNSNVKVVQYGQGAVVIPYPSNFQPLEVFTGENFCGDSARLSPNTSYNVVLSGKISSFVLKRGYMATLAQNANGTGTSMNYVAADGDIQIASLPDELNNQVLFIRIFPWHWVAKKGSCDISPSELNATWHYNWNIWEPSPSANYEYAAIKQQPYWPGLDTDYMNTLGVCHLLGFNEPDNPVEDAYQNLTPPGDVNNAVVRQPELLGTGLRLGAPAVTDGGRSWILNFMSGAEAAGYRIDYVPIHYYRSYWNNADPAGAANNLYTFLKDIYDQTHKPIWLTEFNNGANWTTDADPTFDQNRAIIEAMINMMDNTPWLERYSVYSAVEEVRQVYYNGGGYTPMGTMYKTHEAPIGYQQIIPGKGMAPAAFYDFEHTLNDRSGSGNHAISKYYPDYVTGHDGGTAVEFNGIDDHIILPDSLSGGMDFTFAAWVYWNGGGAWQRIFDVGIMDSYSAISGKYMMLTPDSGSGLRFAITTSGYNNEQTLTTSALPQNVWTHVAVTISGNTGRLYINGSEVDVNTAMTINPADLGAIHHYLGRSTFPSDAYFSGKLNDVMFQNKALNTAQVGLLAAGDAAPQSASHLEDGGQVMVGEPYHGGVSGLITDAESAPLSYTKVYGPDWLAVDLISGAVSGIPDVGDAGIQPITVQAADAAGQSAYIILTVDVQTEPHDFEAGPVAYWDFAEAGSADGALIPGNGERADLDGDGSMDTDDFRIGSTDRSGNGNHLTAWTSAWMKWSPDSLQGDFSMMYNNSWPAAGTDSAYNPEIQNAGYRKIDAEAISPINWTVEVVFKAEGTSGTQTLVGRDGRYVGGSPSENAALYLSMRGADLAINYTDVEGATHNLQVAAGLAPNIWYTAAATSDGTTLRLYLDGTLIGSLNLSSSGTDTALGRGYGTWSVARGMWADGHVDRFFGNIDAVAISGTALTPGSFVTETFGRTGYDLYTDRYGISGAAFEEDADTNGIPNGMEYYLGTNPSDPFSPTNLLTFSSNYQSVLHPYNASASGVTGIVEWTTNLASSNWKSEGSTYTTNAFPDTIEASFGSSTNAQRFIRLKVNY